MYCKYTCYIIAHAENKYFGSIWQINTAVFLPLMRALLGGNCDTHAHKRDVTRQGGQQSWSALPAICPQIWTQAGGAASRTWCAAIRSLTMCLMSAQDAQRMKRLKPSADGVNPSVTAERLLMEKNKFCRSYVIG